MHADPSRRATPATSVPTATRWIRRPQPRPAARLRLFCLPHAGGTPALFKHWPPLLPEWIEPLMVCLPGRENRFDEPLPEDIPALVAQLAGAVRPWLDRPWALFGHSMGATLAYELTQTLVAQGGPMPEHLVVSARIPPQRHRGGDLHRRDDDALCARLIALGGTPPELLSRPEFRAVVLPAIREDYRLIETYRPDLERAPLPCPLTVFRGRDDADLDAEAAGAWSCCTSADFRIESFPGGHFYLSDKPGVVVARLGALLAS
ncbi:oleoyl-ACP hydrolase [Marichromatium purpuratum 984]|uniref:Oleoyl-ACP hydrolase n=1 Tax=Marichromatium purpuratum 984 TaxID=765910 RepID=W0E4D5_MARPU|nr:alpha/beta fold hydrolase [Marichromatium purpuratum]AHF03941.1 oleoyl-ACP hydrolase [Marichromatium purpuratum 984]